MKKRSLLLAAVAALLCAAALVVISRWDGEKAAPAGDDAGAVPGVAAPRHLSGKGKGPVEPPPVSMEADPEGDLRLEGQVVDESEAPVAGATVRLSSNPPRTAKTSADGSFAFDKLIGKTYWVSASKKELVGGPVRRALTETSDPVIIHMVQGATVHVTVLDQKSSQPVAGAKVKTEEQEEVTDAKGHADLRGIASGYAAVRVHADGYAAAHELVQIPASPGIEVSSEIRLRKGAPVSGHVVDAGGAPVAGARVTAQESSSFFPLAGKDEGVETDAEGAFTIETVAAGTYRFVATDKGHPPASSKPLAVDGEHETSGVDIVLEAGATLAGRVQDAGGAPVPWATVRVRTRKSGMQGFGGGVRGATADGDGAFEVRGLPRKKIVIAASSEEASSALTDVDLTDKDEVRDLVITLDVEGAIAGIVVNGDGEPVAEAQVRILPDFWSGGDLDSYMLRGGASQSTDGGGRFRFSGLPDGKYRLHAARTAARSGNWWQQKGTPAQTGDTDVEVLLAEQGSLRGRLAYEDGSAPKTFTVAVGYPPGVPVADDKGEFSIPAVPPGTHDVTFRGPGFAETVKRDVKVGPGEEVDLGTVTVKRGRSVSGRVIDASGAPVAGATVVVGRQVVGNGKSISSSGFGKAADEFMGIRRAETDEGGAYRITGIGTRRKQVLVAEHPDKGRALPVEIPAGPESVSVDLPLRPFGSVGGTVRAGGEPAPGAQVIATAPGSLRLSTLVTTGGDGAYQFERLAEGSYTVTAIVGAGIGSGRMGSAEVNVVGDAKAKRDIEVETGDVTLTVTVKGEGGAQIDAAQVFVFDGAVRAETAEDVQRAFMNAGSGGAQMTFAMGGKPATLEKVTDGQKTVCVIPLSGDLSDPTFMKRVQENAMFLDVHCQQRRVEPSPKAQTFEMVVPPMSPLPEPQDDE